MGNLIVPRSNLLYEELGRDYVTEGPVPAGRTGAAGRRNVNVGSLDNDKRKQAFPDLYDGAICARKKTTDLEHSGCRCL